VAYPRTLPPHDWVTGLYVTQIRHPGHKSSPDRELSGWQAPQLAKDS